MARTKARARRGPEGHAFRENAKQNAGAGSGSQDAGARATSRGGGGGGNGGKRKRNRGGGVGASAGAQIEKRDGNRNASGEEDGEGGNKAKRRKGSESAEVEGEGEGGEVKESVRDIQVEGEGIAITATTTTAPRTGTGTAEDEQQNPASMKSMSKAPRNKTAESSLPVALPIPIFPGLENTYAVTTMSIISSSHITKKVSRILEVLSSSKSEQEKGKGKGKENVVMMYAKAPVVSKVVSVAEIVKREIGKEGGKWFSYCVVGEVVGERGDVAGGDGKGGRKRNTRGKEDEENLVEEEGEGSDEEEAFEVMKTPFERALESEGKPKVRAMPVMSLYLSRSRIEGLRMAYGEQTNAQEVK
ncbi:hypothetical protein BKA65DRAFT_245923 [Rhexocercosporidium sp. MPI-PUGE-AT-0058]|nr:hypothetical protein BKA65DRAFT_245923 [Rhexocercosporidium sp. MPI-PUGE-AT-0058]